MSWQYFTYIFKQAKHELLEISEIYENFKGTVSSNLNQYFFYKMFCLNLDVFCYTMNVLYLPIC